jgi:regulatory protein
LSGPRGARRPEPLPGSRARPGEGEGSSGEEREGEAKRPRGTARDRALNLLSFRDRSSRELEGRLLQAGFDHAEVSEALDGLSRAGLVDDERFARAVVEQEAGRRLSGRRAVAAALIRKRVDRETARAVLAELDESGDERARAQELAEARATRLRGLAPQVAHRRLTDFLMRRGHAPATARDAASRALSLDPGD